MLTSFTLEVVDVCLFADDGNLIGIALDLLLEFFTLFGEYITHYYFNRKQTYLLIYVIMVCLDASSSEVYPLLLSDL